jgi:hypothetical protein
MTYVGIDYSKNSPGVCIREGDNFRFLSFTRGVDNTANEKKKDRSSVHFRAVKKCGVEFYFHNSRAPLNMDYSESEAWKINDAISLAELVISVLPDEIDAIGIEGFSYGAKGNAVLDMAGYGYCMRAMIVKKYGYEKLWIFSPSAVKKMGGKGNAGKNEMLQYFLASQDPALQNSGFWQGVKNNLFDVNLKPTDDLIDSYWVQECTRIHTMLK